MNSVFSSATLMHCTKTSQLGFVLLNKLLFQSDVKLTSSFSKTILTNLA